MLSLQHFSFFFLLFIILASCQIPTFSYMAVRINYVNLVLNRPGFCSPLCPCLQPFSVCKLSTGKCSNWPDTYKSSVCDHWCFLFHIPCLGVHTSSGTLSECTLVHSLPSREGIFCSPPPYFFLLIGRSYLFFRTQTRSHLLDLSCPTFLFFSPPPLYTCLNWCSFLISGYIASCEYLCSDFYCNNCPL